MPEPGVNQLYLDEALTQVSVQAAMNRGYVAKRIFPNIPGRTQTGKVFRIDVWEETKRDFHDIRAPGAQADEMDIKTDAGISYNCEDHARTGYVTDEEKKQAATPLAPAVNKVWQLVTGLELKKEKRLKDQLETAFASKKKTFDGTAGKYYFDDYTNGDPIVELITAIKTMKSNDGLVPNVLVCDEAWVRAVMNHPDFQARVTNTLMPSQVTARLQASAQLIAEILGLEEVVYAELVMQNTAGRTAAGTVTRSEVWGRQAYLIYREMNPGFQTSTTGVHVLWDSGDMSTEADGGIEDGWRVETWREAKRKSDGVMVNQYYDQIMLHGGGYWLENCLSP
jgi:hypothetical protein